MVAITDIDWVVISLQRTPERLQQFYDINAHLGLPIEVFRAIDGLQLDRDELVQSGLISTGLEWRPGALGAALSNRLLWLRAADTGRPVCIFEDDIYLRNDFADKALELLGSLPPDWDIIHFGYNTDSVFDAEVLPGCSTLGHFSVPMPSVADCRRFVKATGPVIPLRLHNSFGNCAYAVSPSGGKKLVDGCFPLTVREVFIPAYPAYQIPHSKDVVMNGLYRDMSAYICLPPIVMPLNDKTTSTVGVK